MNPQLHDEFVALTALFFSGELSEEDWGLLQVHMAYCDECRLRFEQYEKVNQNVIPMLAWRASADSGTMESDESFAAAEQRLMAQLPLTQSPSRIGNVTPFRSKKFVSLLLAACAVGVISFLAGHDLRQRTSPQNVPVAVSPVERARPVTSSDAIEVALRTQLAQSQKQFSDLLVQERAENARSTQASLQISKIQQQLKAEGIERDKAEVDRDALAQQVATLQADAQSLRAQLATNSSQASKVAALQDKVNLLNVALIEKETALNDKDRMLALDNDFLSHDREIRDLIGARNLYIADIYDTNENGKTSKPFGRIFYTKDRSLVFYGFDLDKQAGIAQSAAFQVWGSGSDKQTVSLGMFYQDDSHKRWVLRCNDAKALTRLNMVFVTAEPPGGSTKPTGKRLLRAYLQIDPNHP